MVERTGRHAPPTASGGVELHSGPKACYHAPTLTVYGSVRDLTRGTGIGKPDNGVSQSHSKIGPFGS